MAQASWYDDAWHLFRHDINLSVAFSWPLDFCSSGNKKYTCASAARLWGINWARRDEGVKKKATQLRLKPRPRLLDAAHQTAVSSFRASGVIDRAELCLITSSSVISVLWICYKRALPCSSHDRWRQQGLREAFQWFSDPFRKVIMIIVPGGTVSP